MKRIFVTFLCFVIFLPSAFSVVQPDVEILSLETQPLKGELVHLKLSLKNTGDQTAFFPYFRMILPEELSYTSSTCKLGAGKVSLLSGSTVTDPYNDEIISLAAGETFLVFLPPIGHLSPDQPDLECDFDFAMTAAVQVQTPFVLKKIEGVFALGDKANGEARECGGTGDTVCDQDLANQTITPQRLKMTTTYPQPSVTGETYAFDVNTCVDVASGETLTGVDISLNVALSPFLVVQDPGDCSKFSFTGTAFPPLPGCTYTPDAGSSLGGGQIDLNLGSSLSDSFCFSYPAYLTEEDDDGNKANDPQTGAPTTSQSDLTFTSVESGEVFSSHIFSHRSHRFTKNKTISTDNLPNGYSPGDEVEWTLTSKVSDYFIFKDYSLTDILGDGQSLVGGSFQVVISENTGPGTIMNETDLLANGHLTLTPQVDGSTEIILNLSAALADPLYSLPDALLSGASHHTPGDVQTKVSITYRSIVLDDFSNTSDPNVDAGALLKNTVSALNMTIAHDSGESPFTVSELPLTSSFNVVPVTTFSKSISALNDAAPPASPILIQAGDEVTFSLQFNLPGGGVENLKIKDYLPSPIFAPSGAGSCLSFDAAPLPGGSPGPNKWLFKTNDMALSQADITVNCNTSSGLIEFAIANQDVSAANLETEILFTLTTLNEPIADGLQIVNTAVLEHKDSSASSVTSGITGASFKTGSPNLEVEHKFFSSSEGTISNNDHSLEGVDAGALVEFTTKLENTGNGVAQDGTLSLVFPTPYQSPSGLASCDVTTCGYDITFLGACGSPSMSSSDETQIHIADLNLAVGEICDINYKLKLSQESQPHQIIKPEIKVTWTNGGTPFAPKFKRTTTTIKYPSLTIDNAPPTSDQGTSGEFRDFLITATIPQGTSQAMILRVEDLTNWLLYDETSIGVVTSSVVSDTIEGAVYYCSGAATGSFTDKICFSKDPNDPANYSMHPTAGYLSIDLGKTVNGFLATTPNTHEFLVQGTLRKGVGAGNKEIRTRYFWSNPNGTGNLNRLSNSDNFVFLQPSLTQIKCLSATSTTEAPFDLNESPEFIVQVKNTGNFTSTAFDIEDLRDTLIAGTKYQTGSLEAYYCSAGAASATCGSWPPAGCANVSSLVSVSNQVDFSVVGKDNKAQIESEGYFTIKFKSDFICDYVSDVDSNPTTSGSHPASATGGLQNCGGQSPVPAHVTSFTNELHTLAYTSLEGVVDEESELNASSAAISPVLMDHDGDGISTADEGSLDTDGDGVPNYLDTDSDDNGVDDKTEGQGDHDSDGHLDYADLDDDGDGLSDAQEFIDAGGQIQADSDGDGLYNYLDPDSDGDGVADGSEKSITQNDGDAEPNQQDKDSDNDGLPDLVEFGLGLCDDGSGVGSTASNGILEADEITNCSAAVCLTSPCDSDGNGALESDEFSGGSVLDSDGDGVPNAYDLDSDNDGLPDLYENLIGQNTNSLGVLDVAKISASIDGDGDGFITGSSNPALSGELLSLAQILGDENSSLSQMDILDSDGDGVYNFMDSDSDNDGLPDVIENNRAFYDESGNSNNQVDYGAEYDVIADANYIGPDDRPLLDTDSDGLYNYLDSDSDDDGISDLIEAWLSDVDSNQSGSLDEIEFVAAVVSLGNGDMYYTTSELPNTDGTGLEDMLDLDSDDDGILDQHESEMLPGDPSSVIFLYSNLLQSDVDTLPDFRDLDSDDDGLSDQDEAGDSNSETPPLDTDGDGFPDSIEVDSDKDGLLDGDELSLDPTGFSKVHSDSDGDFCDDGCEVWGDLYTGPGVCPYIGKPWASGGAVATPITSILKQDTDGGGAKDCDEANDSPATNPSEGYPQDDAFNSDLDDDGDGLTNFEELNYTQTDPHDPYTDADGLHDGCEVLGSAVVSALDCPITDQSGSPSAPYLNPKNPDTDGGSIWDDVEVNQGLDPLDPSDDDIDGDGLPNQVEINLGLNPEKPDTNEDCLDDGFEVGPDPDSPKDTDGDGLIDALDPDNDNDGLSDCEEVRIGNHSENSQDVRIQGSGAGCGRSAQAASTTVNLRTQKDFWEDLSSFIIFFMPAFVLLYLRRKGGLV